MGRVVSIVIALVVFTSSDVFACPVCFGAEESEMINGTKLGVLALLAVLLAVQGGFIGFFLYLRKRAKLNAEVELEDELLALQRGSRTT